ncbi:hypothetical protein LJC33_00485 [Eubacteriales bacterium OttesenSCG-928-N13]|nr:hypothetical protein [Eubacteriales bacterium OttesenSCG-928-N13]
MIINMTGAYQPPVSYIPISGYECVSGSRSYGANATVPVPAKQDLSFRPKMVYGWAQFASGSKRAYCGGDGAGGYFAKSDGTYSSKSFTFYPSYVNFSPNGTAGTCYYYIAGSK